MNENVDLWARNLLAVRNMMSRSALERLHRYEYPDSERSPDPSILEKVKAKPKMKVSVKVHD